MSKETSAKRINVISLKMIKEGSILYDVRRLTTPSEAAGLGKRFLEDLDREQVLVCCLDNKNQPVSITIVSTGTLNSSLVHPREVFKTAILSNAAGIILFTIILQEILNRPRKTLISLLVLKTLVKSWVLELLDHIIIGSDDSFCSLKERNHI